jgi:hypothetical protein
MVMLLPIYTIMNIFLEPPMSTVWVSCCTLAAFEALAHVCATYVAFCTRRSKEELTSSILDSMFTRKGKTSRNVRGYLLSRCGVVHCVAAACQWSPPTENYTPYYMRACMILEIYCVFCDVYSTVYARMHQLVCTL